MTLTPDELRLCAHAYALRHDQGAEAWFEPAPDLVPEAHRLWQRDYLERRWLDDDLVY